MGRKSQFTQELLKRCDDCEQCLRQNPRIIHSNSVFKALKGVRDASHKIDCLLSELGGCEQCSAPVNPISGTDSSTKRKELVLTIVLLFMVVFFWRKHFIFTTLTCGILALGRWICSLTFHRQQSSKGSNVAIPDRKCRQELISELVASYSESEARLNRLCDNLLTLGNEKANFQDLNTNALLLQQLLTMHLVFSSFLSGLSTVGQTFELLAIRESIGHIKVENQRQDLTQLSTTDTLDEAELVDDEAKHEWDAFEMNACSHPECASSF